MRKDRLEAIDVVPFKLNNISDFVIGKHPLYHPETQQYDEYWIEQIRRCIEGYWGNDSKKGVGGYRWMPGNLYFYINFGVIKRGGDENTTVTSAPDLRCVEWIIFYGLAACDGFSGFDEDPEYCSFRPVGKMEKNQELTELDTLFLEKYGHQYKKKNGKYKKYRDAREIMYETHKKPLGRALYHNSASNFEVLSTRRLGKSYSIGEGVIAYDFTFNGARTLEEYLNKTTSSTIVVGAVDYKYTAELYNKVELCYNHLKNVGAYKKDGLNYNGCLWHPIEGLGKQFKEKGGVVTNLVSTKGGQGKEGAGSQMINVSYATNSSAGVGYGARRMICEESGLLDNFDEVHGENSATQKHDWKYGYTIYIGTGGNIEKIKGIKDSFYNPGKYDILSYPNVFTKGGTDTGLFFPSYYKNTQFYTPEGNLDIERSFKYEMQERESKKGSVGYQRHTISFPIIPQEMFHQSAGNRFNTALIEDNITRLESGDFKYSYGSLEYVDTDNKIVKWTEDIEHKLTPFLRRGDEIGKSDTTGAIVIYEHPQSYKPNRYTNNPLYIVLYDPVGVDKDEDNSGGTSLCSVIVYKLYDYNDSYLMLNVVAEWHGRFNKLWDNHQQVFKIADYYGCKILPETNHEDIVRYAKLIRRYDDLEDRPEFSANEIARQKRKYIKGFAIPPKGKAKLEEFLVELLDTEVYKEEEISGNESIIKTVKVIERIPSIRILEELRDYSPDENFDAVSCMFLAALYLRNKNIQPISERYDEVEDSDMLDFTTTFSESNKNEAYRRAFNY